MQRVDEKVKAKFSEWLNWLMLLLVDVELRATVWCCWFLELMDDSPLHQLAAVTHTPSLQEQVVPVG